MGLVCFRKIFDFPFFYKESQCKINSFYLLSNGEIISSAIFCSNLASVGKLGERSVAGYMTADALPSRTRDG